MTDFLKEEKIKHILITTGIYPPKIGGPAQYAKNLKESFEKRGLEVSIKTYTIEDKLLTGIRHIVFFLKIIPKIIFSNVIFTLDTYSVGFPSVLAGKIFGKKVIVRTGGDFLWESYVERTNKKVLLKNFYDNEKYNFSTKEKIIFLLTKWTLKNANSIIFSTEWQRDIFVRSYSLDVNKTCVVENYYGPKEADEDYSSKEFVASTRKLVWKNLGLLENIFNELKSSYPNLILFSKNLPYQEFIEKIKVSYAVILVSLGDISPNMIMDAIRFNKPFICTKEIGIYNRIKDAGIFVDPLNEQEIKQAILELLTEDGYKKAKEKVRNFQFVHTWEQITDEFLVVANKIK